jgi:hypothetical protein
MTAQQQLAEFNGEVDLPIYGNRSAEMAKRRNKAYRILRTHGPAIAELIEAAIVICASAPKTEPVNPESSNHDDTRDFASDWADWYTANQLRTALRKLTQEATP